MKIAQMHLFEASFDEMDVQEFYSDYKPTEQDIADMMAGWADVDDGVFSVDYVAEFEHAMMYTDGDLPW
jgi:hypothetical protein